MRGTAGGVLGGGSASLHTAVASICSRQVVRRSESDSPTAVGCFGATQKTIEFIG